MSWFWNPKTARYHWKNGSQYFIPRSQVLEWMEASILASEVWIGAIGYMAADGKMSPDDFATLMKREVKREYIRQYVSGIGGEEQMTQADWGRIGGLLQKQYRYIDKFAADIAVGNVSPDQARVRARLYSMSARQAFFRADWEAVRDIMNWVRWVNKPGAAHCEDCPYLQSLGWLPAKPWPYISGNSLMFPGSGHTDCITT